MKHEILYVHEKNSTIELSMNFPTNIHLLYSLSFHHESWKIYGKIMGKKL